MKIWVIKLEFQYASFVFWTSPPKLNRWNRFACQSMLARAYQRCSEERVPPVLKPVVGQLLPSSPNGFIR